MPSDVSVMPSWHADEIAAEVVELPEDEPRAALALLRVLLDAGAAHAHERELSGDEEAVEQHQHEHGDKEQRRRHARRRQRRGAAPLLREGSSSFIRATRRA